MATFVSFANTGEIGIAAAKKSKPDVILMDVVMPETNGFQATRKITKDPENSSYSCDYGKHQKPNY
jgi:twitching motility two-component system response regulator PilH